jgi:hypothetical protein
MLCKWSLRRNTEVAKAMLTTPLLSLGNRIVFILLITCGANDVNAAAPSGSAKPLPRLMFRHIANIFIGKIPICLALHEMLRHPMLRELGFCLLGQKDPDLPHVGKSPTGATPDKAMPSNLKSA